MRGRGYSCDQNPPRHQVFKELPWETTLDASCHNLVLEELTTSCATPLGKNLGNLSLVSSGLCLIDQLVKNPRAMQETPVQFLGREDTLEKG